MGARMGLAIALAMLVTACGPAMKPTIERAKAQLADPATVIAKTCAPAASPLCACIVGDTVKMLQAGPREIIKVFEQPDAVFADALSLLDPKQRAQVENEKAAAEMNCRAKLTTRHRDARIAGEEGTRANRPRQSLRSSCSAANASAEACSCYERTLRAALSAEAFAVVREDAGFPPTLLDLPEADRATVRATIAAARSACGLATPSL